MAKLSLTVFSLLLSLQIVGQDLIKFYNGDIYLADERLEVLCDSIIQSNASNYLYSLAYYQKAILASKQAGDFSEYAYYEKALDYLNQADTSDVYLMSAILENQGVVLMNNGLFLEAAKKTEKALPYAFKCSISRGLSLKYDLARSLKDVDDEKSLRILIEILEDAEEAQFYDRMAKVYVEIGMMFVRSEEYKAAILFLEKAMTLTKEPEQVAFINHNYAYLHFKMGNLREQEKWLHKSLNLGDHKYRFVSLVDMGECLINQGRTSEAEAFLKEAGLLYPLQPLCIDNLKVFDLLMSISEDKLPYSFAKNKEYQKIIDLQNNLMPLLKKQAMLQLYLRLKSEKEAKKPIELWQIFAVAGGCLSITILLTWRICVFAYTSALRKRLNGEAKSSEVSPNRIKPEDARNS